MKKRFHFIFFLLAFALTGIGLTASAQALTVKDVRFGLHPDKTRLVIELSEISKFRVFAMDDPYRLVIDMPSFGWQAGQISKPVNSPVAGIRQGPLEPGISRIVIDLKGPVAVKDAFLLRANEGRPDRLVVDFSKTGADNFAREKDKVFGLLEGGGPAAAAAPSRESAAAVPPPPAPPQRAQEPAPQTIAATTAGGIALPPRKPIAGAPYNEAETRQASAYSPPPPAAAAAPTRKKPLIVLDPGHGGVDPGAIGANGVFEKHIALAMAKDLKQLLESTGRYDVILTRDRDTYKRLHQRVEFARAQNADLFISLHADSIGKGNVRGTSVYTLSEKASDEQTARLAERENKADIIAGVDISHEDAQVANILIDLAMRDTMNQSKFFANTLTDNMGGRDLRLLERPHRSAGFAVLKAPDIPSVLIELGFMSNKSEAQALATTEYRMKLAHAILTGIDAYFEKVGRNNRI